MLRVGVQTPGTADEVAAHGAKVVDAVEPFATGGVLPNFAPSTRLPNAPRRYDDDVRIWLGALATQFDPAGVLRVGQVVPRA